MTMEEIDSLRALADFATERLRFMRAAGNTPYTIGQAERAKEDAENAVVAALRIYWREKGI